MQRGKSHDQEDRGVVADAVEGERTNLAGAGGIACAQGMGCQRIGAKHVETRRGGQLFGPGLIGMKQPAVGREYGDRRMQAGEEALRALFQRERRAGGFGRHNKNGGGAVGQ